jgi:acetone carboxylase gamma subunit
METQLKLPSRGCVYEGVTPEGIKVRTLRGKDEKLLSELNVDNIEKKYLALLQNVVTGIDPAQLTLGDRTYILLWLRINSYSPIIDCDVTCDNCFVRSLMPLDLAAVNVKELPEGFVEPYNITLSDEKIYGMRLFRLNDEIKISDWEKRKSFGDAWIYRWIVSIVDDRDIIDRIAWYENLPTSDTKLIRKFHEDFVHGPELDKIKYTCPKCGHEGSTALPFRANFLLPSGKEA